MKYYEHQNAQGETTYGRCKAALERYGFPNIEPIPFDEENGRKGHMISEDTMKSIRANAPK